MEIANILYSKTSYEQYYYDLSVHEREAQGYAYLCHVNNDH